MLEAVTIDTWPFGAGKERDFDLRRQNRSSKLTI